MKKFFINLLFALLIAGFVYFVVAGKSVSDLVGKETLKKADKNEVVKTLRDNVLGPPSATSSDENIFQRARSFGEKLVSGGSGGSATSTATSTNGKGPLSDLLENYDESREEGESSTSSVSVESSDTGATSSKDQAEGGDQKKEKVQTSKLPEFNLICTPEYKQICNASGCEQKSAETFFSLIDEGSNQIYNCVSGQCSGFDSEKREADSSINYSFVGSDGNVHMLSREKSDEDKKSYVELVTKGGGTEIYYGTCR